MVNHNFKTTVSSRPVSSANAICKDSDILNNITGIFRLRTFYISYNFNLFYILFCPHSADFIL
jgi:hypothetical protein